MARLASILIALVVGDASAIAGTLEHRWLYLSTNLLVDKNVAEATALIDRAAKAGYTGVVLTDSKFMRWDNLPERYAANARRVRDACRANKLALIACVCPIGYSNDLLSRDPNLAEGLPVKDAPFVARGGKLVPHDTALHLVNGGFEQSKNDRPAGWQFVDQPGKISFLDAAVRYEGRTSLRMQDIERYDPVHGHGRACQKLAVRPFHYYHVSAAVKTHGVVGGEIRMFAMAENGAVLSYYQPPIARTQDWKRVDMTFNSLEAEQVNLYFGIWGGRQGTLWWDDVRIEPAGLGNVVRRDGAPLQATSADGKTVFQEGRDFDHARDPLLGMTPYAGAFNVWHDPPLPTLPPGSRIAEGEQVRLSYFHTAIIHQDQVMCCMAEPKLYEILGWQITEVRRHLQPDGYFLQHDEIRVQGWDESCRRSGKTPGELLADNVRQCVQRIRAADPGKPIYVWSDMFDPAHNAAPRGRYYLVRGDGPWTGSWKGLDREVGVVNWNSDRAQRMQSLQHFAALGNRQILAGYYDGPVSAITGWLHDAQSVPGVNGTMYTTWRHEYGEIEAFARQVQQAGTPGR